MDIDNSLIEALGQFFVILVKALGPWGAVLFIAVFVGAFVGYAAWRHKKAQEGFAAALRAKDDHITDLRKRVKALEEERRLQAQDKRNWQSQDKVIRQSQRKTEERRARYNRQEDESEETKHLEGKSRQDSMLEESDAWWKNLRSRLARNSPNKEKPDDPR